MGGADQPPDLATDGCSLRYSHPAEGHHQGAGGGGIRSPGRWGRHRSAPALKGSEVYPARSSRRSEGKNRWRRGRGETSMGLEMSQDVFVVIEHHKYNRYTNFGKDLWGSYIRGGA